MILFTAAVAQLGTRVTGEVVGTFPRRDGNDRRRAFESLIGGHPMRVRA